jgi:AraC family transcriptional regulator of adaptative response/methylated-DNA-[protein]-cysteine methyltransferase
MNKLTSSLLNTPLGNMLAIVNHKQLYFLEFVDCTKLDRKIDLLQRTMQTDIISGTTPILTVLEQELHNYFQGTLRHFTIPIASIGTPFQQSVWQELQKIPFGQTRSYVQIAHALDKPLAFRAVALANAANRCTIIVPCHRVITEQGKLGGYASGCDRKEWLLAHEKQH